MRPNVRVCYFLQEIRQHLRTQRPTDNGKDDGRDSYEKSGTVDSSARGSDTIRATGRRTNDDDNGGELDTEKPAKTSWNIVKLSTDIPRMTASTPHDTNDVTAFKAMTVDLKQPIAVPTDMHPAHDMAAIARQPTSPGRTTTVPRYVADAEPIEAVTMVTDSVAIVTNGGVEEESVVPFESDFGVDNEECDCDMEDYDDAEKDGADMFDR